MKSTFPPFTTEPCNFKLEECIFIPAPLREKKTIKMTVARRADAARVSSSAASVERRGLLQKSANFRRLVLGCMDSYESEKRRILQGFSRSTRFAFLCTAPNSNLQSFAQLISVIFLVILQNFAEFSFRSVIFRRDFHRILPELRQIANDCQNSLFFAEYLRF